MGERRARAGSRRVQSLVTAEERRARRSNTPESISSTLGRTDKTSLELKELRKSQTTSFVAAELRPTLASYPRHPGQAQSSSTAASRSSIASALCLLLPVPARAVRKGDLAGRVLLHSQLSSSIHPPTLISVVEMPVNAFRRLFATQSSAKSGTMQTWYARLRSRYPSSDPATLIGSFLVLHEVTAVVPLFLGFWGLKSVGAGHTVADWASQHREQDAALVQRTVGGWIDQGEQQAARIGRRYGLFGYQKESKEERQARKEAGQSTEPVTSSLSGDVACLVGSYLFVKVCLLI